MSPGQESSVPEKQELHQPSQAERGPQGVRAGPQEGGDALGLPGTLTDTCAPGDAPSSLRAAACTAGPGGTRSSSEGLGGGSAEGAAGRERESNSAGSRAQGARHSPGFRLPGQAEAGRAQDSEDAPAPAEQISGPPRSLQALQTESSGVTARAESRAPELAPPLGLFLLRPHGVNNPH